MKNIGFLLISNGWSGAENALYNLLDSLDNQEQNITLFINEEIIPYYQNIIGLKIISLGSFYNNGKRFMRYISCAKRLLKDIQINKIDILILFLEKAITVYSYIYKKNKTPFILSLRGSEINFYTGNIFRKIIHPIFNYIMKQMLVQSTAIHSHNHWQIKRLKESLRNKLVIIPNGVNTNRFKPSKNVNQKKKVVLFAGRFIEIKGIKEILNVAKQLPQYEFWFAGKGELNGIIVGKNIKNLGFQTTEQLVRLYNQATICIFPSHWEAFGNVGLEAMACAKAVIATPLGFSEYIENGKDGIIIPEKDEDALKNAIMDLMTNEKKRKILEKNARKKALQYSWDNVAREYHQMCRDAIKKTKRKIKNEPTSN